ncbi:unnamed protein product [Paramecium octaurelia]|uniref:Uncharacterized protein n=1 Tax=Paramecium octaurelia TaxID=43137 RepID=A0A8S1YJG4_PAROT|nr:unnamed protein product [Paramecium octaurelia]
MPYGLTKYQRVKQQTVSQNSFKFIKGIYKILQLKQNQSKIYQSLIAFSQKESKQDKDEIEQIYKLMANITQSLLMELFINLSKISSLNTQNIGKSEIFELIKRLGQASFVPFNQCIEISKQVRVKFNKIGWFQAKFFQDRYYSKFESFIQLTVITSENCNNISNLGVNIQLLIQINLKLIKILRTSCAFKEKNFHIKVTQKNKCWNRKNLILLCKKQA